MCTLILAWRVFDATPVAVAANRDELLDRPAAAPSRWEGDPVVVAPRDLEAGGTWIGYNDRGVFAGITNRWGDDLAGERSRGILVRDVLGQPDAATAVRLVERAVDDHEYDPFELVIADADQATLLEWDGHLDVRPLSPGVHVVVNVGAALGGDAPMDRFTIPDDRVELGRANAESARKVRAMLDPRTGERLEEWLDRARKVLADHDYGVCVHGDGFGTRSSSLVTLGDGGASYEFASGPPCETPYRRVESRV